jgi:hypothetical protein
MVCSPDALNQPQGYKMIVSGILVAAILGMTFYYLWFLFWPVVDGKILERHTRTAVLPFRKKKGGRFVVYSYVYEGRSHRSYRQGLFATAAFGPNKNIGDVVRVSVCKVKPEWSCPHRPGLEAIILLVLSFVSFFFWSLYYFLPAN